MSRFTPEDAYEMSEAGDPIMLDWPSARKIIEQHSSDANEFYQDKCNPDIRMSEIKIDAAEVFGWLGY